MCMTQLLVADIVLLLTEKMALPLSSAKVESGCHFIPDNTCPMHFDKGLDIEQASHKLNPYRANSQTETAIVDELYSLQPCA